ncbi:MAG: hypothetical protein M3439_09150 [Chloroflexota bacterium]|nr:hypothetical protein [Chloroflexota bacterium]
MHKLHAEWGDQVQFVDVIVRQAHPGPNFEPYRTFEEKIQNAETYRRTEGISWPVLADDMAGSIHQVYGGLADPSYIIDADGRVAFYLHWTNAPSLHDALTELRERGWRGVVHGGVEKAPHVGAAMTDGWRGLQRGLPQSAIDMELATPGSAAGAWLGHQLRPVLAPVTLRSRPLPPAAKVAILALIALPIVLAVRRHSNDHRPEPEPWMY